MENILTIINKSNSIIFNYFNLSIIEFLIIILFVFLSLISRTLFSNLIIKKIKLIVTKSNNKVDDSIYESLVSPIKLLPIILVLFIISLSFDISSMIGIYLIKINSTLFTIFIFWLIYTLINPIKILFIKYEGILSKALYQWIFKSIQYLILFLAAVAILEVWGIKVGPIIAGLGLFGVAVALGAQDLFKNLISGILILVEKRFNIDDIICVPNQVEGVVEHIGFRSTLIRKFDSTPISIPNHIFSEHPILNYSKRHYRRINCNIGLIYNSTIKQLKNITNDIRSYIEASENFVNNENFKTYVYVEKFNESSIDLYLSTFTNTTDWNKFLAIKEELSLEIKKIIKSNDTDFAYPTTTIFIEKNT